MLGWLRRQQRGFGVFVKVTAGWDCSLSLRCDYTRFGGGGSGFSDGDGLPWVVVIFY